MSTRNTVISELSPKAQLQLIQQRAKQIAEERSNISSRMSAADWIETYFWIPELRGPMKLYPHQRESLNYALNRDSEGNFPFSTIVWSDIKKSAKSSIAAGVALWMAYQKPWSQIYIVANDLKQADSRVGYYMRRAIELNPVMRASCKIRGYRITLPNNSFIESIPIDPSGEAGSNADMVVFSELWGAHEDAQNRMWTEMTTPPTKFKQSFRWVETYAGFSGQSLLLENLWRMGTKEGRQVDIGVPNLELYRNDVARLMVLWNTVPRLPWQTPDYYAEQEATLDASEFQRVHRNQWVSPQDKFIPIEWWDACHYLVNDYKEFPLPTLKKTPCIFAIDAGISNDSFAIVGVHRKKDKIFPFYSNQWIPKKGYKVDFAPIEIEIRRLAKEYNILQWAYDEYQLHDMMTRLRRDGLGWFKPFSQTSTRAIADKLLYDSIQTRNVIHSGDAILRDAIDNADKKPDKEEKRLRLVKRAPHLRIDPIVCLSMATYEALRLNI